MDEKILKDAQYRKGLSIAYFNSVNSAIALMSPSVCELLKTDVDEEKKNEMIKASIRVFRDWFLEEHKNYYATVIAQVGVNYKAEDSIAKLKATKTLEDLKVAWVLLSADERKDGEIRKVAQEIKAKYEKTPSGTKVSGVASTKKG